MIPYWKLKRELRRLRVQSQAIPEFFTEPFKRRQHDKWRETGFTALKGSVVPAGNIALFLIYQPDRLPDSVLKTCDHLVNKGFAPLVVSNCPLTATDRASLLTRCWKLAERPNFGYDFGGYRDGIWLLNQSNLTPDNLLVLNDSVWFPAFPETELLSDMQECPEDFVGTQVFGRVGNPSGNRKWSQPFFGSYCFMIKKNAFNSDAFQNFWTEYKLTSNKEKTLHRGERAFSYQLFEANIPSAGLYSRDRFDKTVGCLDAVELVRALDYLVCLDPKLEKSRLHLLGKTEHDQNWETEARDLIQKSAESKNYIGSSPVVSLKNLKFPMIKKTMKGSTSKRGKLSSVLRMQESLTTSIRTF